MDNETTIRYSITINQEDRTFSMIVSKDITFINLCGKNEILGMELKNSDLSEIIDFLNYCKNG